MYYKVARLPIGYAPPPERDNVVTVPPLVLPTRPIKLPHSGGSEEKMTDSFLIAATCAPPRAPLSFRVPSRPRSSAFACYHVDHVLNGKSVCLGGVCVGGVGKTSRSVQAVPDPAQGAGATVPVPALRGQAQAKQPSCISPAQPSANT